MDIQKYHKDKQNHQKMTKATTDGHKKSKKRQTKHAYWVFRGRPQQSKLQKTTKMRHDRATQRYKLQMYRITINNHKGKLV